MRRILFSAVLIMLLSTMSCQKCKTCSYTYTHIETIQTINGEEEKQSTLTGYVLDEDGKNFTRECVKYKEEGTIEEAYKLEEVTTNKLDFEYNCTETN